MKDSSRSYIDNSGLFVVNQDIELPQTYKLTTDIKTKLYNLENISKEEVRTLTNLYYQVQDERKALIEQIRSIDNGKASKGENNNVNLLILNYTLSNISTLEAGIFDALSIVIESSELGRWLTSIIGVGPAIAAGLMSYFDIEGRNYSSQFISYAGLNDNNRPWLGREASTKIVNEVLNGEKNITDDHVYSIAAKSQWSYDYLRNKAYDYEKGKWSKDKIIKACSIIPYNKQAKMLMWKAGESFHWKMNSPDSLYGSLFNEYKVLEIQKNESGANAEYAKTRVNTVGKGTNAYKAYAAGMIPDAQINARASRKVQKVFLSHVFEEMYRIRYEKVPPRFYALEHLEGAHNIEIAPEIPYHPVTEEEKEANRDIEKRDTNPIEINSPINLFNNGKKYLFITTLPHQH